MNKFQIEFYETDSGRCPVEDFLLSVDKKMRAKILGIMGIVGTDISRVLYFFYHGGKVIFTNGFIKKGQKTPVSEILKAKRYRKDYMERCKNNEEI